MNHTTWILVADSSRAKIFKTIKARLFNSSSDGKDLTLVNEFNHSAAFKKDQELVSDKQGKFGTGTFVEKTEPKKHENDLFALQIAKALNYELNVHHFEDLILIAPPSFIGMLHKHLSREVKKLVSKEIEKDYIHSSDHELVEHLKDYL